MPKIPQYIQDRLMSSQVGTASTGDSALRTASGISSGAANIANVGLDINQQQSNMRNSMLNVAGNSLQNIAQELRVRQSQQAVIDKHRQDLNDAAIYSNASVDLAALISQQARDAETNNTNNPNAAAPFFLDTVKPLMSEYIKNLGVNENVAVKLLEYGNNHVITEQNRLREFSISQNRKNSTRMTAQGLEQDVARMSADPSPAALANGLKAMRDRKDAIILQLGYAEGDKVMQEARVDGFFNWAKSVVDSDYQSAKAMLFDSEDGKGTGLISVMRDSEEFGPTPLSKTQMDQLKDRVKQKEREVFVLQKDELARGQALMRFQMADVLDEVDLANPTPQGLSAALSKSVDFVNQIDRQMRIAESKPKTEIQTEEIQSLQELKISADSQVQRLKNAQEASVKRATAEAKQAESKAKQDEREQRKALLESPEAEKSMVSVRTKMNELNALAGKSGSRISPIQVNETLKELTDAHSKGYVTDETFIAYKARLNFLNGGKLSVKEAPLKAWIQGLFQGSSDQLLVINGKKFRNDAIFNAELSKQLRAYYQKFGVAAEGKAFDMLAERANVETGKKLAAPPVNFPPLPPQK